MKTLFGPKLLLLVATALFAGLFSPALCLADEQVEGVLVLRNGNVLHGQVQQQGDYYLVQLPKGQLQVRVQQVEMVCQNLEEAYLRRREARAGSTADSHFELARWCLRNDLLGHAEAELRDAHTTDPGHPRLAQLRRQLKHSLQMEQRRKQRLLVAAKIVPEPAPLDPVALEKAPPWARALFVRQIQPLVVHSCAAGGCHQSDSKSGFHLNRLAIDGAGHPEATLRNLAATLEQIDWQSADQSDLLVRAKRAHGALSASSPLPPHKLQVLQGWVEQLAEAHFKETELMTLPPVAEIVVPRLAAATLQLNPPRQTISTSQSATPSGVQPASYQPVDPFDPKAFNQRYAQVEKLAKKLADAQPEPSDPDPVPHAAAPGEPTFIPSPSAE